MRTEELLKSKRNDILQLAARHVRVFGSVVRGEDRPGTAIDNRFAVWRIPPGKQRAVRSETVPDSRERRVVAEEYAPEPAHEDDGTLTQERAARRLLGSTTPSVFSRPA